MPTGQTKNHVPAPEIAESEFRAAGFELAMRQDDFVDRPDEEGGCWMIVYRRPAEAAFVLERQPNQPVFPLRGLGGQPHEQKALDNRTDPRILRNKEKAGAAITGTNELLEPACHRSHIVGYEDSPLTSSLVQNVGIPNRIQSRRLGAPKINGRFTAYHALDNSLLQVIVGPVTDLQSERPA